MKIGQLRPTDASDRMAKLIIQKAKEMPDDELLPQVQFARWGGFSTATLAYNINTFPQEMGEVAIRTRWYNENTGRHVKGVLYGNPRTIEEWRRDYHTGGKSESKRRSS